MTPDQINALLDGIVSIHHTLFEADPKAELLPAFMIASPNGDREIIQFPWKSEIEREIALLTLSAVLEERQAVFYCLWSETWTSTQRPDYQGPARDDPQREEGVITAYVPRHGEPVARYLAISRDADGNVTALTPDPDYDIMSGAVVNLFRMDSVH